MLMRHVGIYPMFVFVGALYVYLSYNNGLTWTEKQKLLASDGAGGDELGASVAMNGDVIVVGTNLGGTTGKKLLSLYF